MGLEDPAIKHENLGFLRIYLKITPATSDNGTNSPAKEEKKHKPSSSKVWSSVLTVTLLEGSNFPPMDQNGGFDKQFGSHCVVAGFPIVNKLEEILFSRAE